MTQTTNTLLKPTHIPWIEKIPEDWEVKRLKYATETRVSNVDKKSEDEIGVQLCNYVDVYKNDFIDENIDFMNATATEQKAIIEYIEHETSKIDTAIAKIEKEITLIEEYRTSLIYQAVTGKITIS